MKSAIAFAICGLAAAFVLSSQVTAQAGHGHAIQTANSPSSGEPIAGGGTWIVNRADAYYIGRLLPGENFVNEYTDSNNWHYGRAIGSVSLCGWVMPGSMGADTGDADDSCSEEVKTQLTHRLDFGHDYNAPATAGATCTTTTSAATTSPATSVTRPTMPVRYQALCATATPPMTMRWQSYGTRCSDGDS